MVSNIPSVNIRELWRWAGRGEWWSGTAQTGENSEQRFIRLHKIIAGTCVARKGGEKINVKQLVDVI